MIYSALDLAKQSGVCWGEPGGKPEFETWTLGGSDSPRGKRGVNLMRKLVEHIEYVRPDLIFIETPLEARVLASIGSTMDTTLALQGFVFVAETVAFSRGVKTQLIERQEALLQFTGSKSYPKAIKDAAKKACLARCTQLRWIVADYDQADAAALWFTGCGLQQPSALARAGIEMPVRHSRKPFNPRTRRKK